MIRPDCEVVVICSGVEAVRRVGEVVRPDGGVMIRPDCEVVMIRSGRGATRAGIVEPDLGEGLLGR